MLTDGERDAILDSAGLVAALLRGDHEWAEEALHLGDGTAMARQLGRFMAWAISQLDDEAADAALDRFRSMAGPGYGSGWSDYSAP